MYHYTLHPTRISDPSLFTLSCNVSSFSCSNFLYDSTCFEPEHPIDAARNFLVPVTDNDHSLVFAQFLIYETLAMCHEFSGHTGERLVEHEQSSVRFDECSEQEHELLRCRRQCDERC